VIVMDMVSVITPAWNSEKYIEETIRSVQRQSYTNWEMIIVDDGSTDNTVKIVENISKNDTRIRLIKLKENGGAAKARNCALMEAGGRFIAYLDADDIWKPDKLKKQVQFMQENRYGFSCTSYEVIDDSGKPLNKYIHMLPKVDYYGFLTHNLLQTVGIMVDTSIVDRKYLIMPDMKRRQDAATWLNILRAGFCCYGLDEILAEYRRTKNSLSSNKFKAAKNMWFLYRKVECLSFPFSCFCFLKYAMLAVWKRMYFINKSMVSEEL